VIRYSSPLLTLYFPDRVGSLVNPPFLPLAPLAGTLVFPKRPLHRIDRNVTSFLVFTMSPALSPPSSSPIFPGYLCSLLGTAFSRPAVLYCSSAFLIKPFLSLFPSLPPSVTQILLAFSYLPLLLFFLVTFLASCRPSA